MPTAAPSTTALSRAAGTLMLLGTVAWTITFSVWPSDAHHNSRPELAGGLVFQLGLAGYLTVLAKRGGAGTRWGRRILTGEAILLALASVWSVGTIIDTNIHQHGVLFALDLTWPLSMVWLVVVAVAVLRAGRFHGISRFAPLSGSLWLAVDGIGAAIGAARPVHVAWMLASYGWLSLVLFTGQPDAEPDVHPRADLPRVSVAGSQA